MRIEIFEIKINIVTTLDDEMTVMFSLLTVYLMFMSHGLTANAIHGIIKLSFFLLKMSCFNLMLCSYIASLVLRERDTCELIPSSTFDMYSFYFFTTFHVTRDYCKLP